MNDWANEGAHGRHDRCSSGLRNNDGEQDFATERVRLAEDSLVAACIAQSAPGCWHWYRLLGSSPRWRVLLLLP